MHDVVVVGQVGRDLVLGIERLPEGGGAAPVHERRELLGGKGANQAVGCRRLGLTAALVGVVGADGPGDEVLAQARGDGIDTTGVVRRDGGTTALLVDVVEDDGTRRLLEHVPSQILLDAADVRAQAHLLRSAARLAMIQLQQPDAAVVEAVTTAHDAGVPVLVDGATRDPDVRRTLLATATVLRADRAEAALLVDRELADDGDVVEAARDLAARGPDLVALSLGSEGNVVAWPGGHLVIPVLDDEPVDTTGAGDAFMAGLAAALLRGEDAETAGWWASAAAALTVDHLGGRPTMTFPEVEALARRARREHG